MYIFRKALALPGVEVCRVRVLLAGLEGGSPREGGEASTHSAEPATVPICRVTVESL